MISQNIRLRMIILSSLALLLIPLVAMQFTNQVSWSAFDFIVMGTLLCGTGLAGEFVLRKVKTTKARVVLCIGILLTFLLVWTELAVGVLGTPFAGS